MKNTKRSLTTMLFAFLILSGFTNCEEKKKDQGEDDKPKEEEVVNPPRQIVSLEQAKETYNTYTDRRVGLIEESESPKPDGSPFDVARYVYYDYETIKQYIAYIEQEAKRANTDISSLRFYLSNYPDSTSFKNGNEVIHPRQNSIFLIPATKKDGMEYPFIVDINEQGESRPVLLTGQLDRLDQKGMGLNEDGRAKSYAGFVSNSNTFFADQSLILNEGSSAPPPNN